MPCSASVYDCFCKCPDPNRLARYRDDLFTKFSALLNDKEVTKKRLQAIADKGRERAEEITADQQRAAISSVASWQKRQLAQPWEDPGKILESRSPEVRVFRPFPAWKCNMVLMSSKFEGRVAETRLLMELE